MKKSPLPTGLVCFLLFTACRDGGRSVTTPSPSPVVVTASTSSDVDRWAGRWTGAEGTYLDLSKYGAHWTVQIADLDRVRTYDCAAVGDHLEFKRGDKTETIRPTDGKGTGMKWLTEEKNCLVITVGSEGYCRK